MLRLVRRVTQPARGLTMATAYQVQAPMVLETHCRSAWWNVLQMVVRVIVERPMRSVQISLVALTSLSVSQLLK